MSKNETKQVSDSELDSQVLLMAEKIKIKEEETNKELKGITFGWETSMVYELATGQVNLITCTVQNLRKVALDLIRAEQSGQTLVNDFGFEEKQVELINGFTLEQWKQDIQKRNKKIQLQSKTAMIEKMKAKLETLKSEQQKRKESLDSLESMFKENF